MSVLAITGMKRESRLLAGAGIVALVGGGDASRLLLQARKAVRSVQAVLSIGLAGGLATEVRPGDWIVADEVIDNGNTFATHAGWSARLASVLPDSRRGAVVGSDFLIGKTAEKASLHQKTGALIVDMESHVAARVAAEAGLPFAVARVVSDSADRTLPPAVSVALRRDGDIDFLAIVRSLVYAPAQLPDLIRTAREASRGFRALALAGHCLGPDLGFRRSDLGELPGNVV